MNREAAPEIRIGEPKNRTWNGCLILLGCLVFLLLLPIIINTIRVAINQLKWNNAHITNYSITIVYAIPVWMPPQTTVVQNGKVIKVVQDGKTQELPSTSGLVLLVDDLFSQAYGCFIYRFCSVEYDEQYDYPTWIGGGFIERSGINVVKFEPNGN